MAKEFAALSALFLGVALSAQQAPPPPQPVRPAEAAPIQGGRGSATGPGAIGGADSLLMEAPRPVGSGAISGVVTNGSTGAPIEGALVALNGNSTEVGQLSPSWPIQLTDSKGRFVFTDLPAGSYSLGASGPGYLNGGYRRVPGVTGNSPVVLTAGQWFSEAHIKLWRPAAISGMVRDERGEALVGVRVRMLVGAVVAGRERWASGPVTQTDDRGMYRFGGLVKGRYLIHVPSIQISLPAGEAALYRFPSMPVRNILHVVRGADDSGVIAGLFPSPPADEKGSVYPSVFHPAARSVDKAEPIALDFAEDRGGVDIEMVPVPSVQVSGSVAGPADVIAGIPVRLIAAGNEQLGLAGDTGVTKTDAAGRFAFQHIPSGDYTVVVSRSVAEFQVNGSVSQQEALVPLGATPFGLTMSNLGNSNGVVLNGASMPGGVDATGRLEVSVGARALSGLVVQVTPTVRVSGFFDWDGSDTPPAGARAPIVVRLEPADGDVSLGVQFCNASRPDPNDPTARITFLCESVKPGRYALGEGLSGPTSTFRLIGASWNGRDLIDLPLEVSGDGPVTGVVLKLSSQMNKVGGTVRGAEGRTANDSAVIMFPAAQTAWREAGISSPRFRSTNIGVDGAFDFGAVLPGEYLLAAVSLEERARVTDATFLAAIAGRATRVKVGPASTVSQELRVIRPLP
ncbi:MAG TPA: carboxypeptidase-like regulatory domain-containing protein [Vicinamibacterales bacterium]|nr:carboxypeptidase-like regulatory domain-containing protein [Vicinamibacterales bacterium]